MLFRSFSDIIKRNFSLTLAKLNFYVDMSVWLFVGKQYYRLDMYGTREQIDASGPLRHIPSTFQKLQIPGKTGRFTGDIEDFLRPKSNDFDECVL